MSDRATERTQSLALIRNGDETCVAAGDAILMRFTSGDLYMGGVFLVHDIRFRANGPLRIANLAPHWSRCAPRRHPARVDVRGRPTAEGLRVEVRPDTRGGVADVTDTYEFAPDPGSGGWQILRHCRIAMRRDVKAADLGFHPFPDPRGRLRLWWEIDDPNYAGGYGPSVPMRQDWLGMREPNCGPDTFRKHWRRRVEKEVFLNAEGRVETLLMHRALTLSLALHNRRALPFRPGGFAGVLHDDGWGTLYDFLDGAPTYGHICEWGFDTHFWRLLPGDPVRLVLRKGRVLEARFRIREATPEAMRNLLRGARAVEPTAAEWTRAEDLPVYEEPVNRFATSWRDPRAGDAWAWKPGVGATWDRRTGRRRPGSLRLDSPRHVEHDGAHWTSPRVGPSNFMNPIAPGARYRLSGYVKIRPAAHTFLPCMPSVSMTFHPYAGPGTFAPELQPNPVFTGAVTGPLKPGRWQRIEAVSAPVRNHVLGVTLGCHLHGDGAAWFDELRFEKVRD